MAQDSKNHFSRREVLTASLLAGGAVFLGSESFVAALIGGQSPHDPAKPTTQDEFLGGKHLGNLDFVGEPRVPMDSVLGTELDGRLYTDLSTLAIENPAISTERFFIRTRASKLLDANKPWSVLVSGAGRQIVVTMQEILRNTTPQGMHLMECAGNMRDSHFGMISVADWGGVPISKLSEWLPISDRATRVLISGFDSYGSASTSSVPGASWIFSWDDLLSSHAFLATKMNGQPLSPDHGAPVRLIVPGWYGCASIKWVNAISIADDGAAATSQMQEYAFKTHQRGMPKLASEYDPPKVDPAAVPIRVEKWAVHNQIKYRVVGIVWGGAQPVESLQIRFNPEQEFIAVKNVSRAKTDSWTIWTHTWVPQKPDTYLIRLRVADSSVRTRRLDMGFYARTVRITQI